MVSCSFTIPAWKGTHQPIRRPVSIQSHMKEAGEVQNVNVAKVLAEGDQNPRSIERVITPLDSKACEDDWDRGII
jgi:hypothetical protein